MLFHQVLAESDRSRKALEFQLKMKTLEIEAALDTAEETRKKIVELTSEKQKVKRLVQPARVRPCAESARAVTGRRCPHSGVGEDFLGHRPGPLTKTGVTRERKVVD